MAEKTANGNQSPTFSLENEEEEEVNLALSPTPSENVIGSNTNQTSLSERERQLAEILQNRKTMLLRANSLPNTGLTAEQLEIELQKIGENARTKGGRRQTKRRHRKSRRHQTKRRRRTTRRHR